MKTQEIYIKNMVCSRCLKVVKQELEKLSVSVISLELGKITIKTDNGINPLVYKKITEVLCANDFEIVQSEEEMLVEYIKIALIALITKLPLQIKVKTSEHLSEAMNRDYKTLSKIFSKNENITIEKYFIKLKIEKAKELIQMGQYSFSEIAYLLNYSSVNHLSRQFKNQTGMRMTDYKNEGDWERNFYDEIV